MELYRLIEKLQNSSAFMDCHPFAGASVNGLPIISWKGKNKSIPSVILSYLALPVGKRRCTTPNCANPFHFLGQPSIVYESHPLLPSQEVPQQHSIDDYLEAVEEVIDSKSLQRPYSIEKLRPYIPVEDIPDLYLTLVIEKLK